MPQNSADSTLSTTESPNHGTPHATERGVLTTGTRRCTVRAQRPGPLDLIPARGSGRVRVLDIAAQQVETPLSTLQRGTRMARPTGPTPPTPHLRAVGADDHPALLGLQGVGPEEYDETAFYVRSVDDHGHSAYYKARLHPGPVSVMNSLLMSGQLLGTPITSLSAALRDALIHRLHYYAELVDEPWIKDAVATERMLAKAEQDMEEQQKLIDTVERINSNLDKSMSVMDVEQTKRLIESYEMVAEHIREPYKGRIETALARTRQWLKGRGQ